TSVPGPATDAPPSPRAARTNRRDDDHLRHIVCITCYPAFAGTREAPHDAVCICGKLIQKGDAASPNTAPHCIMCDELREHHLATVHRDD
ncbi:MAG TPA: hypothetical protein VHY21_19445, partial [Pseudonocardiaceae bacterium]|nr:hypothetical protein [Pseudonocardiaceae bacterium]